MKGAKTVLTEKQTNEQNCLDTSKTQRKTKKSSRGKEERTGAIYDM